MARRRRETLTDKGVLAEPEGLRCDGGGLYLRTTMGADGSLNRAWLYRFAGQGRERWMGLGAYPDVSLKEARELADEARRLRRQGVDPIDRRREGRAAQTVKAARQTTFREAADGYIRSHGAGWRNAKHAAQWPATLKAYVYPVFGHLPVQAIDTALVLKALEPIWNEKPETASRVRGRIESVLDWAKARGASGGREPSALARPSRQAVASAVENQKGQAPCSPALRRAARLHGATKRPRGGRCARARLHHPDRSENGRNDRGEMG